MYQFVSRFRGGGGGGGGQATKRNLNIATPLGSRGTILPKGFTVFSGT